MPTITRTTVTTRSSGFRSSSVPVWAIKLLTVVLALIILLLVYLQVPTVRANHATTFIIVALTCGLLLGWSIGSVLQQVLCIRTVEIMINLMLTILTVISLIFTTAYIVNRSGYGYSESHKLMVGTTICFLIETVVCILMLSWAYYGNVIIVDSR